MLILLIKFGKTALEWDSCLPAFFWCCFLLVHSWPSKHKEKAQCWVCPTSSLFCPALSKFAQSTCLVLKLCLDQNLVLASWKSNYCTESRTADKARWKNFKRFLIKSCTSHSTVKLLVNVWLSSQLFEFIQELQRHSHLLAAVRLLWAREKGRASFGVRKGTDGL